MKLYTENRPLPGKAVAAALCLGLASLCLADGERDLTEKTGHRYVSNVTETVIDDTTDAGYRMTDIEVVSTGPHKYSATFVRNSGPYQTGWWWKANVTEAQMVAFLTQHEARIIDLETYIVDGQHKFAFVALPNPSREFVEWWYFAGKSWDDMNAFVAQKTGRLIDVDVEVVKGKRYFSGIVVRNTGQNHKNWLVFSNITTKQIKELMSNNGDRGTRWRLVDLERISNSKFAGILQESEGQAWWWFTNQDWEDVKRLQGMYASRIFDIERHEQGNKARFDILLLDNSNDLEWRIGNMLRGNTDGTVGFMLKEVNGPTLGAILPDFRTYPASTIKVLQHYYWSSRFNVSVFNNTQVPIYNPSTSDTHNQNQISQWLSFLSVTQFMMWNSGNNSTNALQDFAGNGNGVTGRTNINNFAWNTLGLNDDIQLFHKFADGNVNNDPYNRFTMRQITKLYEQFANGVALNNVQWQFMHDNMLNETGVVNNSFRNGVRDVMLVEGDAIGLTQNEIMTVFSDIVMVWKPGNVSTMRSSAGWIRLPFKTNNGIEMREFVVGVFDHDFTNQTITNFSRTFLPEILRDQLKACLDTYK